jgi:hypothetical protein
MDRTQFKAKLTPEQRAEIETLAQTAGMSQRQAAEEVRKVYAREAKKELARIIRQGIQSALAGVTPLPKPDADLEGLPPEEYVRRRALAAAPWALEQRIRAAATGNRLERREAQQELLDRAGFGRRVDHQVQSTMPAIQIRIDNNPYLKPNSTVEGEVIRPELPEEFSK